MGRGGVEGGFKLDEGILGGAYFYSFALIQILMGPMLDMKSH